MLCTILNVNVLTTDAWISEDKRLIVYIFLFLVPPDIQIEDSGKSVAPLKMEIIGSRQKTEVDAVTWVFSLWVKMRTASIKELLSAFFVFISATKFSFNLWLKSISSEQSFFQWMCTDNSPKLDHTRKHFKSAIAHFFTDNSDFKLFQGRVPSNDKSVL